MLIYFFVTDICSTMLLICLMIVSTLKVSSALIGFDCGSATPNITTYSLLNTGECDLHVPKTETTNVKIELLQIIEFKKLKTIQCKIKIHRSAYHCGVFGHLIPAELGEQEFVYEISHEKCQNIHDTGIFKYDNQHVITDLKINNTITKGIDFAGSAAGNTCTGMAYADAFGSYNNVFVQGTITIQLFSDFAEVNLDKDKIRLNSGTMCKFSDKSCVDLDRGYTFWKEFPEGHECMTKHYDILYKGLATKTTSNETKLIIFSMNSNDVTFSLIQKEITFHCNRNLIRTEHPKLLIFESKDDGYNNYLYQNDLLNNRDVVNFNLATYVNSKFVYVERHLGMQANELYINLLQKQCELEQNTIRNSLALASIAPDEFALDIMKQPGYLAMVAGEVVHLIKCIAIDVKLKHTSNCFDQLPVTVKNETWYMAPKTHILSRKAKQLDCNSIVPPYYKINNDWFKFLPSPTNAIKPNVFNPNTKIEWKYEDIRALATSGIYSQDDLQKLQQQIMFPMEKSALLNTIARQMAGVSDIQSQGIENMFTEQTLWNLFIKGIYGFWEYLKEGGSVSSVLILLIIIWQFLKITIDTLLRGLMLHRIYGFSIHILGALFNSVTQFFLSLQRPLDIREEQELQEVIVERPVIPQHETIYLKTPPPIPSIPPYPDDLSVQQVRKFKNGSIFSL